MNVHIINCDETLFLEQYRTEGYLGVGIVTNMSTARHYGCKTSYSMYADMKTIIPGDMIFVHAGNYIYGVFKAESEFLEDSTSPSIYQSKNVHYLPSPTDPNSGWKIASINGFPSVGDYRRIAVSNYIDENENNQCYHSGFLATEVFNLKRKQLIWSIPERWKYPDEARIIRPLMLYEAQKLIQLLELANSDIKERLVLAPAGLNDFIPIEFILNPDIIKDEKIIEGWICDELAKDRLFEIFGNFTCFGNNVQLGYLQGADIYGYQQFSENNLKYKIVEVKKDSGIFPENITQLFKYMDWTIEHLTSGDSSKVDGFIVAKDFDSEFINFAQKYNLSKNRECINLIQFDYDLPDYRKLILHKV